MHEHIDNKIKCDCCGTETLAEVKGDKLIIIDRRHGRKHVVVLTVAEILSLMAPVIGMVNQYPWSQ